MKYKVGIIGCGHISDTHIKSWKKAKYSTVHGLFDLNKEIVEKKSKKYNIDNVYDNIDLIIEECDVLDICTPPNTHFEICKKAIEAGKDVLIEKPLVTDVEEWKTIKELIKANKTKLAVLHNLKFNLSVQKAKKYTDKGGIGQIIRINRYFLTHPDSDRMLKGNNHWSHKLPGGRWYETMPHELYLTHYFAGWSSLENVTVLSTENALEGAKADEVEFTLKNDKVISTYHYSSNCHLNKRYIEIIGTKGIIFLDVLSDMMFVDKVRENKIKRALGITWVESMNRFFQGIPDRLQYGLQKIKNISPHTRIILQFDRHIVGKDTNPTPMEEIDFVVEYSDIVGKAIDKEILKNQQK